MLSRLGFLSLCLASCAPTRASPVVAAKVASATLASELDAASAKELALLRVELTARLSACESLADAAAAKACRRAAEATAANLRSPERILLQRDIDTQRGFAWLLSTYDGCAGQEPPAEERCDSTALLSAMPEILRLLGRYAPALSASASASHAAAAPPVGRP